MTKFIARLLVSVLAVVLAARIIPGIELDGLYTAVIVTVLLGLLNVLVRPILVILTLPLTILSLGLFLFVLNAAILWFVSTFVDGFTVGGFVPAVLGALLITVVNTIGGKLIK